MTSDGGGTFRPFIEHAWSRLQHELDLVATDLPEDLADNETPAKGMPEGSTVKISVQAMKPSSNDDSPVQYARYALLETQTPTSLTDGIQVLNLVVFCKPIVWGVDLVSLPGNKHLLALDAQPMSTATRITEQWKDWHKEFVQDEFEWGGDIPEPAQKFFSPYVLWTRMNGEDAIGTIQTKVMEAFQAHQEIFLQTIQSATEEGGDNHQAEYLDYRRTNDPARPMLKSLYGADWTERLIEEVLFPEVF